MVTIDVDGCAPLMSISLAFKGVGLWLIVYISSVQWFPGITRVPSSPANTLRLPHPPLHMYHLSDYRPVTVSGSDEPEEASALWQEMGREKAADPDTPLQLDAEIRLAGHISLVAAD